MTVLQGAVLGLIQGIGEFLPISSSGHLLLAQTLMKIDADSSAMKMLSILLHVGTLIPVIIVFWKDWMEMILHPVRNRTLLLLVVASLPTLAIYLLAKKLVVVNGLEGFDIFNNGWFLGVSFLITALFLLICDRVAVRQQRKPAGKGARFLPAVVMGCFQGIGMIPGVSRSGSTILGGVSAGLNKTQAARFSFLMSAPAILGSLLMEGKDALESGTFKDIELFPSLVGIAVAAATGFLAIRFMLRMIGRVPLSCFAVYVGVVGIVFMLLQLSGSSLVPAFKVPSSAESKEAVAAQAPDVAVEDDQSAGVPGIAPDSLPPDPETDAVTMDDPAPGDPSDLPAVPDDTVGTYRPLYSPPFLSRRSVLPV